MQIDLKQASYNNFLLSAKMTYKLSWKIIETKIAEPEKMLQSILCIISDSLSLSVIS